MLKILGVIVLVLLLAVVALASTKPDSFRVTRTVTMNAPAEKIFPLINDFHQWTAWSPYERKDSTMTKRYSGAASGKGAVYEWNGNSAVGEGRMELLDATPTKLTIKLDFEKPVKGSNTAEFDLVPKGATTDVSWTVYGPTVFFTKIVMVFTTMDKMIGDDFSIGLESLKTLAEKP